MLKYLTVVIIKGTLWFFVLPGKNIREGRRVIKRDREAGR
jgi:hypothetical protein